MKKSIPINMLLSLATYFKNDKVERNSQKLFKTKKKFIKGIFMRKVHIMLIGIFLIMGIKFISDRDVKSNKLYDITYSKNLFTGLNKKVNNLNRKIIYIKYIKSTEENIKLFTWIANDIEPNNYLYNTRESINQSFLINEKRNNTNLTIYISSRSIESRKDNIKLGKLNRKKNHINVYYNLDIGSKYVSSNNNLYNTEESINRFILLKEKRNNTNLKKICKTYKFNSLYDLGDKIKLFSFNRKRNHIESKSIHLNNNLYNTEENINRFILLKGKRNNTNLKNIYISSKNYKLNNSFFSKSLVRV